MSSSINPTGPVPAATRKWWILIAVGLGLFLGSVDGSIVNVAVPTLIVQLDASFPTVQWVILSYLLGLTLLLVGMGRLADMMGKKRIFTTGTVLFVAGSALCGLAPTIFWLIAFRVLQSVGAAMIIALGTAILTETWPNQERGKAIGFAAGFISLGIVVGPAIGGLLLNYLTWHWIFFVNIPIGVVSLLLVTRLSCRLCRPRAGVNVSTSLARSSWASVSSAFALSMTMGQEIGFTSPLILVLLVVGLLAIPGFIWVESRVKYPIIDLSLFKMPQFSLNLFTATLAFVAIAGIVLLLPFYLELVMGLQLRQVGGLMAVVPLVMIGLQPASGWISDRLGTRPVSVVGLVFIFLGYLAMSTIRVDGTALGFVIRMLPIGIGMAIFNSPNNSAIMGCGAA